MGLIRCQVPCVAVLLSLFLFNNPEEIKAQGISVFGKREFAEVHFDSSE